ncbi:hypothetical protein [Rothia nasimurium]|uniref:hypothetical protein n=1 Tax=Rothia nasimurium TaxID=85336 RepID=UPI001F1B3B6E|nr:hypothetical protein [Rothia nasimurium]
MTNPQQEDAARGRSSYQPTPKKRRGNRRATGGSSFTGAEPHLAGLAPSAPAPEDRETLQEREGEGRASWLKEQRPPHYGTD